MNIEKSIEILKGFRNYNKFYKEENRDLTITITLDAKESIDKAIERLLTAYEKEKEKNKELEKMLNLKSHKRRYNTMNYIKKNKLNKFDTVGICQDMRAFKRTGEIKYRAYITFQNKQYTLGTYTSLDKAKEARKKGEIMVENIKKNFVEKIKGEE